MSGSLLTGTLVSCTRRNNQRNRIHGMALDIQAIPSRKLVQRAPAASCVVSDKGPFYQMKESTKLNDNCRLLEENCANRKEKTMEYEFTSPVYGEMNIFSSSRLR